MTAKLKTTQKSIRALSLLISVILMTACNPAAAYLPLQAEIEDAATTSPNAADNPEIIEPDQPDLRPLFNLPENLAAISPENTRDIRELANVYPYFPPFFHISNDGTRIAVGDLEKIEIRESESGKLLTSIPVLLPDCDFGFGRFFRLNADGSFAALINGNSIQVWQTGGGMIYDSPLAGELTSGTRSCGPDIPELALSPDGKLLAVSGMEYSSTSVKRYFQVIDILENKVLYEWNGKNSALNGNLYTFYGLGFSDDGQVLQTFDPTRFISSQESAHQAFRFWSTGDWQEIERTSRQVEESFQPGLLQFSSSNAGEIEIRSKVTGEVINNIRMEGCSLGFSL